MLNFEKYAQAISALMGPEFQFNPLSWDSIMQVVERVESLRDDVNGRISVIISDNSCTIKSEMFRPNQAQNNSYYDETTCRSKKSATVKALGGYACWLRVNRSKNGI